VRFLDVNNEELRPVLVSFEELLEGTKLVPERRSGVAAKNQQHRPLAAKARQPHFATIRALQFEIRGAIADAQFGGLAQITRLPLPHLGARSRVAASGRQEQQEKSEAEDPFHTQDFWRR